MKDNKLFKKYCTFALCLLFVILSSTFCYAQITDGLIRYYSFDSEDMDGSNIYDLSGTYNATNSGGDTGGEGAAPLTGDSLYCNSANSDYLDIGNDGMTDIREMTWCTWIKSGQSSFAWIMGVYDTTGQDYNGWRFNDGGTDGKIQMQYRGKSGNPYHKVSYTNSTINDDSWHLICSSMNVDDDTQYWQIDGQNVTEVLEDASTPTTTDVDRPYYVCARNNIGVAGDFLNASIDEFMVWNRHLNYTELNLLWNEGDGCAYPFDSCSVGQTLTQSTEGILDVNYNNVSLNVSEGDDLFLWINYSFLDNSSTVYPNSWCEYSGSNMTWNATLEYFITPISVPNNGTYTYDIECYTNLTNTANLSTSVVLTSSNLAPSVSWISDSGSFGTIPQTFNWTCSDPGSDTLTSYLLVNDVLNSSGVGLENWVFNYDQGTYNLSVYCSDGSLNSTVENITITYVPYCLINLSGFNDQDRLRTNEVYIAASCDNGINLTGCSYSINDYASESFDCTGDNVTLEVGKNVMVITTTAEGLDTSKTYVVYAKKMNLTFSDLFFPIGLLVIIFLLFLFKLNVYDTPLHDMFIVFCLGLFSSSLFAINLYLGAIGIGFTLFCGLFFIYNSNY